MATSESFALLSSASSTPASLPALKARSTAAALLLLAPPRTRAFDDDCLVSVGSPLSHASMFRCISSAFFCRANRPIATQVAP